MPDERFFLRRLRLTGQTNEAESSVQKLSCVFLEPHGLQMAAVQHLSFPPLQLGCPVGIPVGVPWTQVSVGEGVTGAEVAGTGSLVGSLLGVSLGVSLGAGEDEGASDRHSRPGLARFLIWRHVLVHALQHLGPEFPGEGHSVGS